MSRVVFKEVTDYYRQHLNLTHAQRVTRLYRQSLRTIDSWFFDRETVINKSTELRARFDAAKNLPADSGAVARLLREGEAELAKWTHPDMYTVPYMPGGSKFMRNPSVPLKAVFPDGIPPEYNFAAKDVTGVQVPMSANPKGRKTLLVDMIAKTVE